jgi:hypothetical protein
MATPIKVTLVKRFTYRGNTEEWGNSYHLSGANPADGAAWEALVTALATWERSCLPSNQTWVRAYGYNIDSDQADYRYEWVTPPAGYISSSGSAATPGDAAVWVRWTRTGLSNGRPVYLRKYFHGALSASGTPDTILAGQKTALLAFGAALEAGTDIPGARHILSPNGTSVSGHSASSYITTRTLKRRGKRPNS